MINGIPLPAAALLRARFIYDAETGVLTYAEDLRNSLGSRRFKKGDVAGRRNKRGYRTLMIDGVIYREHRLIWRFVTGEDPGTLEVDHRNRIRDDNRWENLRLLTHAANLSHRLHIAPNSSNTSGTRGVRQRSNSWVVRLEVGDGVAHKGRFKNKEDAVTFARIILDRRV